MDLRYRFVCWFGWQRGGYRYPDPLNVNCKGQKFRGQKVKSPDLTSFCVGRLLDELEERLIAEVLVLHAFVDQSLND